jgi:Tol biopolymer transport system component
MPSRRKSSGADWTRVSECAAGQVPGVADGRVAAMQVTARLVAFCIIVLPCGCSWDLPPLGEDSWSHYKGGGVFPTNSGSMSEDGQVIVFASPRTGNGDIYAVARNGTAKRRVTTSQEFEAWPLFAPGSDRIYFARETNKRRHIWVMNADGSNLSQVTFGDVLDDLREFSSDGTRLIINRSRLARGAGRSTRAYLLDLTAPGGKPIALGRYATFGPSKDVIAYNPEDRFDEVWLKDLRTSKERRIGTGSAPLFSPDGKWVLTFGDEVTGESERDWEIWLINVHEGEKRRGVEGHSPCFLTANSLVFYTGFACQVWIYDIQSGETTQVDAPIGSKNPPVRSLDGSGCLIRVVSDDTVGALYFLDAATRSFARVTTMK